MMMPMPVGTMNRTPGAANRPTVMIGAKLVMPPARCRPPTRAGDVVPLADSGQQEHLVVHRLAGHDRQHQDRLHRFDRAGRAPACFQERRNR